MLGLDDCIGLEHLSLIMPDPYLIHWILEYFLILPGVVLETFLEDGPGGASSLGAEHHP